jgi:hypothetical protein
MASNPSVFSPIGVDAMTGGYFMVGGGGGGGGMMSADVPHFHPSVLLEHGGFGFSLGDAAVGATVTASDLGASNVMLASLASQFLATGPAPQQDDLSAGGTPPEEMDEGYGAGSGGSCVAASLQCPGHSDGAMAFWPSSSSSKKSAGTWSSAGGSRAVTVHEPYHHLAGLPDVAGFHYLLAAGAVSAPASSELSLTLCSKSSQDTALNAAAGQCSSGASRSELTELHPRARPRPAAHFSVVVARSRYATVAQEVLNDVVGHMLDGVADAAADSCSGVDYGGGSAGAPSVVSSSNRLMASSEDAGERRGEAQRVKSDLLNLLQLVRARSSSKQISLHFSCSIQIFLSI